MPELNDSLTAAIDRLLDGLPPRRRLVVGVSGGLDSMLLLDLVRARAHGRLPLLAVHVHHGLSPRADAWAAHVAGWCAARDVPVRVLRVAVDRQQPSREAAARDARHAAFATLLEPGDALLLAHHADDQAETLLLRLMRGSGIAGLGAMRPARALATPADAWLLRPLLAFTRAQLARAAAQRGLSWVEDESNTDTAFDRNFLRHDVLPLLRTRWPAATGTLADTARRLAAADALLDTYLDADLAPLLAFDGGGRPLLDAEALLASSAIHRPALLRRWLARAGAPVFHEAWLDQVLAVAAARDDSEGAVCVAGWEVHRFRGRLHVFPALPASDPGRVLPWSLRDRLELELGPGHGTLIADPGPEGPGLALAGLAAGDAVTVRFRAGGERCAPAGGAGTRPLKKILQDLDVPPWLRARIPLVYAGDRLVAVGDLVVEREFAPGPARPATVRLRWTPPAC